MALLPWGFYQSQPSRGTTHGTDPGAVNYHGYGLRDQEKPFMILLFSTKPDADLGTSSNQHSYNELKGVYLWN